MTYMEQCAHHITQILEEYAHHHTQIGTAHNTPHKYWRIHRIDAKAHLLQMVMVWGRKNEGVHNSAIILNRDVHDCTNTGSC